VLFNGKRPCGSEEGIKGRSEKERQFNRKYNKKKK
jgi:hypothetical protein